VPISHPAANIVAARKTTTIVRAMTLILSLFRCRSIRITYENASAAADGQIVLPVPFAFHLASFSRRRYGDEQ
jgi:hypothetical protein